MGVIISARKNKSLFRYPCFHIYSDRWLIEDYHNLKEEQQKRLMAYMEALKKIEILEEM